MIKYAMSGNENAITKSASSVTRGGWRGRGGDDFTVTDDDMEVLPKAAPTQR